MSHIEKILNQANQYFVEKLLGGEYEILKIDQYTVKLKIDEKYDFELWVSTSIKEVYCYQHGINYMRLEIPLRAAERLHSLLSEKQKQYDKDVLKARRLKEYQKLKAEFENDNQ